MILADRAPLGRSFISEKLRGGEMIFSSHDAERL